MIALIVALLLSLGITGGAYFIIKRNMAASVGSERARLVESVQSLDEDLEKYSRYTASYASRSQFDKLIDMVEKIQLDLENEKQSLKDIESKLDVSQKQVETKEFQQQELKSAREEDEVKLAELLAAYENISGESISLEQQLAQSLKNLDTMMEELQVTDEQRSAFEDLSDALTTSGALLRELITEYSSVNERLNLLREQHEDLEDEYTRLVEQQLGE